MKPHKPRVSESNPVRSPLSEQFGREIFELDTNAGVRLGGFSRPLTKLHDSVVAAITAAVALHPAGDMLVKPVETGARRGWQVFERRTAKGRVVVPHSGSHGRMVNVGTGRIFIA